MVEAMKPYGYLDWLIGQYKSGLLEDPVPILSCHCTDFKIENKMFV